MVRKLQSDTDCPRRVATIGLHGSASTWVFNVVRELMATVVGEDAVLPLFAEGVAELGNAATHAGRYLIVKSHAGSPQLDAWLAAGQARLILSIRDPRDAVVSMVQRFGMSLNSAMLNLVYDCARMIRLAPEGHAVLRYENRFFDDPGTVRELAEWLGLRVAPAAINTIFERYRTSAVRSLVQNLAALPVERQTTVRTVPGDNVTRFLSGHIGNGCSNKWQDLPSAMQDELMQMFGPFLDHFGYAH